MSSFDATASVVPARSHLGELTKTLTAIAGEA